MSRGTRALASRAFAVLALAAVSLSTAQGASRRDLAGDERRGGHTLARHVGLTDEELRARLRREPRISAASTWQDRATAEAIVARTLERERSRVERWVARRGSRPNLALDYRGRAGEVIGRSLRRGRSRPEPCTDAVVVLRFKDPPGAFYVLTSYPEVRR